MNYLKPILKKKRWSFCNHIWWWNKRGTWAQYARKGAEIDSRYFLIVFRLQPRNHVFSFHQPYITAKTFGRIYRSLISRYAYQCVYIRLWLLEWISTVPQVTYVRHIHTSLLPEIKMTGSYRSTAMTYIYVIGTQRLRLFYTIPFGTENLISIRSVRHTVYIIACRKTKN